jgi:Phosphotransferase enzyme family
MHLAVTGEVETVHERPWANVWRVPTTDGPAWFKACAPSQAFEPDLTTRLAMRSPELLPSVIAHDSDRAWLLLADAGDAIGFDADLSVWSSILPRYAQLQSREAAHAAEHLQGGVPDRRLRSFPRIYESMLARHDLSLATEPVNSLRILQDDFEQLCDRLSNYGLPDTIQHDDLHGGNVHRSSGFERVLDWGDACVSHPFLTAYVTFAHLDNVVIASANDRAFQRLRDAYLEPWGNQTVLREAFALAYRLGPFAHVFKELHVLDAIPEDLRQRFAPDMAALLRRCLSAAGDN